MIHISEKVRYTNPEGSATWEYVCALSCSSLIFGIGCVFGWTSPSMTDLMGPNPTIFCTNSEISMIVTWFGLGLGLAPLLTVVMADKLGRKNSLLAISVPMIAHWGLIAVAKDAKVLSIARFIGGLSGGLGLCLAPMYLGEIASVKLRGALGMVIGTMTNAGVLCMFTFMPYLSFYTSGLICLTFSTLSMISVWFISESPYFLAIVGKVDEAEGALEKLRGKSDVTAEMNLIKRAISHEEKQGEQEPETRNKYNAFRQLMTVAGNRRGFSIIFLFVIVLQFGSYVATMLYGHILFEAMKTTISPNICTTILASVQLIFNILTTFLVDRFGRKPLICISGLVSGVCVLVVAAYFFLIERTEIDVTPYSIFPVCAMFLNIAAVSIGLMPLQMVVQAEILATEVKALTTCLLGMSGGVLTVVVNNLYLKVAITWGFGHCVPFFSFAVVTWTCTALILRILPETKDRTFLEIQRDLNA